MPFTVITLKKVPDSLRGDLTRWMQEIATGVYVGSYNSRVREYLWKRVTDTIGRGEATLCYSCRNEIGYSFCTCNTERQMIDYDGIPLVLLPARNNAETNPKEMKHGFSNAARYHQARRRAGTQSASDKPKTDLVFLDIETTGINEDTDQIIEIGAVKIADGEETEFHRLIHADVHIPDEVSKLTGITDEMLRNGTILENSIRDLAVFIREAVLVGYNLSFDIRFLNKEFRKYSLEPVHNKTLDLMLEAKRRNCFQANYKLKTTLKEYGIDQEPPHRALEDAKLIYQLFINMGFQT